MMRRIHTIQVVLICLCLLLIGCGSSGESRKKGGPSAPEWGNHLTEEDAKSIHECIGDSADAAASAAERHGCEAKFVDPYGTDLTDEMSDDNGVEAAHASTVTDVVVLDHVYSEPSVVFTLSFVDPSNEDQEPKRAEVEGCAGDSVSRALSASRDVDYDYTFWDVTGTDVTYAVEHARENSLIANSTVDMAKVEKGLFGDYTAVFDITYNDEEWLESLVGLPAKGAYDIIEIESADICHLSSYPEKQHEERITSDSLNDKMIVMNAWRHNGELQLQIVFPEYLKTEKALSENLSAAAAKKAAKKYVKQIDDLYGVSADYAEALDEETWLVSGGCSQSSNVDGIGDDTCEFTVTVTGTERKPVVGDFKLKVVEVGDVDWDWDSE